MWDRKTSKPLHNAIVWQCRRTTKMCEKLKKQGYARKVRAKTGLVLDPYFSGSKISWLLKHNKSWKEDAKKGNVLAGTVDTYLVWKLTGGINHVTDVSNASRTMLMNIKKGGWDKELLKLFSVPEKMLPEIKASNALFGVTKNVPKLPDGIPIHGILGDQQAALFGQTCFKAGEAKCTFGTGSFILMNTGTKPLQSKAGVLTTVAWQLEGKKELTYALEGGAFVCGAAVQWLRDGLQFFKSSAEVEELAQSVESSDGVEFVPALAGLGAPHWAPDARGTISGLTRGSTRGHIARATLDAMALQNVEILQAMEKDLGKKMKHLRVDGGATANNFLMQLQANYLGQTILRPQIIETTVAGAAYMAGLGAGVWENLEDIKHVWNIQQEFKNEMSAKDRAARLESWKKAIQRTIM
ncbi:MAG: glycerol kinase [Bdellovibrionales bacterium]